MDLLLSYYLSYILALQQMAIIPTPQHGANAHRNLKTIMGRALFILSTYNPERHF